MLGPASFGSCKQLAGQFIAFRNHLRDGIGQLSLVGLDRFQGFVGIRELRIGAGEVVQLAGKACSLDLELSDLVLQGGESLFGLGEADLPFLKLRFRCRQVGLPLLLRRGEAGFEFAVLLGEQGDGGGEF